MKVVTGTKYQILETVLIELLIVIRSDTYKQANIGWERRDE